MLDRHRLTILVLMRQVGLLLLTWSHQHHHYLSHSHTLATGCLILLLSFTFGLARLPTSHPFSSIVSQPSCGLSHPLLLHSISDFFACLNLKAYWRIAFLSLRLSFSRRLWDLFHQLPPVQMLFTLDLLRSRPNFEDYYWLLFLDFVWYYQMGHLPPTQCHQLWPWALTAWQTYLANP